MKTVPISTQASAGPQPQIIAIAGPIMGAAPATDVKWCPRARTCWSEQNHTILKTAGRCPVVRVQLEKAFRNKARIEMIPQEKTTKAINAINQLVTTSSCSSALIYRFLIRSEP